jgi:multiple sugar transport system permease protein
MFYQITVPLCQPVFAYTALITFTGAYGAFLFALTVCQDPNMWTIMVWLYDLQTSVPEHIKVAALVVAMIPTLLVFVSCQRVIMRGIVLPQMN